MTETEIPAADHTALAGTMWARAGAPGVIIAPGVGIERRFYRQFASWLHESGFAVVTYDYRGIGESKAAGVAGPDATLSAWSRNDTSGALRWALRELSDEIVFVGHSGGGQMFGMVEQAPAVKACVLVTAQSGYWRHWRGPRRIALALLWYLLMPGLTRLVGHFPGRLLGLGANLPAGAAREWASWCRSPGYLFDHITEADRRRYARLSLPMVSWSFTDDWYAPRPAVDALLARYGSAQIESRHIAPCEVGLRKIGHFGFFRPQSAQLWRSTVSWIEEVGRTA